MTSHIRYCSDVGSIPSCSAVASIDGVGVITTLVAVAVVDVGNDVPGLHADKLAAIILPAAGLIERSSCSVQMM